MAHLDAEFKVPVVSMVKYLEIDEATRATQRALFMSGEVRNPALSYHQLDVSKVKAALAKLDALVMPAGLPAAVEAVLFQKVESVRLTCLMLQATAYGNGFGHCTHSVAAYGNPDAGTFWGIISRQQVPGLTPPEGTVPRGLPNQSVVADFGGRVAIEFAEELGLVTEERYDAAGLVNLCNRAIALAPVLVEDGWQAEVNPDKGSITVSNEQRKVWIPPTRVCSKMEAAGRVLHEVGTHARRYSNGMRSCLEMLGHGLPEYLEGEDGLALLREQAITGQVPEFDRWEYYLSVGFALGTDGTPRDFRAVYELMLAIYRGQMDEEAAVEKAWERCLRVFRGTDGNTPGACNTKDGMYYDGAASVWQALQDYPDEWRRLDVGKYNPASATHRACLDALGL